MGSEIFEFGKVEGRILGRWEMTVWVSNFLRSFYLYRTQYVLLAVLSIHISSVIVLHAESKPWLFMQ